MYIYETILLMSEFINYEKNDQKCVLTFKNSAWRMTLL